MEEKQWYDDENLVTSLLIGLLILIIIMSQAFAIRHQLGLTFIVRSLLNNNSIYLLFLVYFIFIKLSIGKKNFNLCNICLLLVQILCVVASFLNLFQSLQISIIIRFILNILLLFYMGFSLLINTPLEKHLKGITNISSHITNQNCFYGMFALAILLLVGEFINSLEFDHIVLSLLESIFIIGVSRYLYLWRSYQENILLKTKEDTKPKRKKKKDSE